MTNEEVLNLIEKYLPKTYTLIQDACRVQDKKIEIATCKFQPISSLFELDRTISCITNYEVLSNAMKSIDVRNANFTILTNSLSDMIQEDLNCGQYYPIIIAISPGSKLISIICDPDKLSTANYLYDWKTATRFANLIRKLKEKLLNLNILEKRCNEITLSHNDQVRASVANPNSLIYATGILGLYKLFEFADNYPNAMNLARNNFSYPPTEVVLVDKTLSGSMDVINQLSKGKYTDQNTFDRETVGFDMVFNLNRFMADDSELMIFYGDYLDPDDPDGTIDRSLQFIAVDAEKIELYDLNQFVNIENNKFEEFMDDLFCKFKPDEVAFKFKTLKELIEAIENN